MQFNRAAGLLVSLLTSWMGIYLNDTKGFGFLCGLVGFILGGLVFANSKPHN